MILLASSALVLVIAMPASGHRPGSDGGGGEKSCGVLENASPRGPVGVGATDVSCRIARRVARGSVRGESFTRWRCTGKRTRFGHCHGRGTREGSSVHWFAAH